MPTATVTVTQVPAADVAAPAKKSRTKLFLVVGVLVLLLGVGGFLAKGLLGGSSAPEPDPRTVAGKVETLSPMTLNLADGRYLKLTLALQLSKAASLEAGTQGRARRSHPPSTAPRHSTPRSTSWGAGRTPSCWPPAGGPAPRRRSRRRCASGTTGMVMRVYFAEFLMQ